MEINAREKKLLIALGVIVFVFGIDFIMNSDDYIGFYSHSEKQEAGIKKQKATIPVKGLPANKTSEKAIASLKEWGRDPFRDKLARVFVKKKRLPRKVRDVKLELKAISVAQNLTVAMINSKVVANGDEIAGYIVKDISSKEVILEKNGAQTILKLP